MKERRYKEEYRLQTRLDEKTGKPRQIPVYMGDTYERRADRRPLARAIAFTAAYALCYAIYLLLNSPSARCIYVMPVAACATIPTLYAALGAVGALRAPVRMTRVQRETGAGRLMRSCMGCGVLTALAAAGDLVFVVRNGLAGEGPALCALLWASVCAWQGFAGSRRLYADVTVIPGLAAKEKEAQKA